MLIHKKWLNKMDKGPLKWSNFMLCGTQEARELLPGQCNIICLDSILNPPRPSFWRQSHRVPDAHHCPGPSLLTLISHICLIFFFFSGIDSFLNPCQTCDIFQALLVSQATCSGVTQVIASRIVKKYKTRMRRSHCWAQTSPRDSRASMGGKSKLVWTRLGLPQSIISTYPLHT